MANYVPETPRSISEIRAELDKVAAAVQTVLHRDGTAPNQMGADLDMNGHNILNITAEGVTLDTLVSGATSATTAANTAAERANTAAEAAEEIAGGVGEVVRNPNLLFNHNFLIPSALTVNNTPQDVAAGVEIFSGVFSGTSGVQGLTYNNGLVSFTGGDFYFTVANTGSTAHVTDLVASVADLDGQPRTRGVAFSLVGNEYRVTVGVDALEDAEGSVTPLGSVKLEQGVVATGHVVQTAKGQTYVFNTVAEMVSNGAPVGAKVQWLGYYDTSDGGSNWGVVKRGAHTADGGSVFSINSNTYVEANLRGGSINTLKFGAKRLQDDALFDSTARIQAAVDYAVRNASGSNYKIHSPSGVYVLSDTIDFYNNEPPAGISFCGDTGVSSESPSHAGTAFLWRGANDRPVFQALGPATRGLSFKGFLLYPDGDFSNPSNPYKDAFHIGPTTGFAAFKVNFEKLWVRGFSDSAFKLGDPDGSTYNGQMANSSMRDVWCAGFGPSARAIRAKGGTSEDFYIYNLSCASVSGNDKVCFIETDTGFYINIYGLLTDGIDENNVNAYSIIARSSVSVYQWITEDLRIYDTFTQAYDHPIIISGLRMLSSSGRYGNTVRDAIRWRGFRVEPVDPWLSSPIMTVSGTMNGNLLWESGANLSQLQTTGLVFASGGIVRSGFNQRGFPVNATTGEAELLGPNTSLRFMSGADQKMLLDRGATYLNRLTLPAITGNADNYDVGPENTYFRFGITGGSFNVTGMQNYGDGRYLIIHNSSGTNTITFTHQDTSSLAENRFNCPSGVDFSLPPLGMVQMIYDSPSQRWNILG